ncbi:MAG: hypothetical protein ACOC22_01655 [bacterium]
MTIIELLLEQGYGKDNSNWRGSKAKRRARHFRKGLASKFKCKHCGNQAEEWATVKGTKYKFIPLCKSCHSKYDDKAKNINKKG